MVLNESKQKKITIIEDEWRFMGGGLNEGDYNMAEDMACLQSCEQKLTPPTIKLYGWGEPTLTIGYTQQPKKLINIERARQLDIPIIITENGVADARDDSIEIWA